MKKLIILTAIFLTSQAFAENVSFAGTISTSCTFSNFTAGVLVSEFNSTDYRLSSDAIGGSRASFDIAYTGAASLLIEAPTGLSSSPAGTPNISNYITGIAFQNNGNNSAAQTAGANSFSTGSKMVTLNNSATSDTATVKFIAVAFLPFPVGSYGADVVVACQ